MKIMFSDNFIGSKSFLFSHKKNSFLRYHQTYFEKHEDPLRMSLRTVT